MVVLAGGAELGAVDCLSLGGDLASSLLVDGTFADLASLSWMPLTETSGAAGVASGWIPAGAAMAAAVEVVETGFSSSLEAEGARSGCSFEAGGTTTSTETLDASIFATPGAASFFSLALRRLEVLGLDDRDRDRDRPLRGLRLRRRLDRSPLLPLRGAERLRDDLASGDRRRWLRLLFLSLSRRLFLLALCFRWLLPPRSRDRDESDEREELAERERLRPRDLERAPRRRPRLFLSSGLSDRLRLLLRLRSRRRLRLRSRSDRRALVSTPISAGLSPTSRRQPGPVVPIRSTRLAGHLQRSFSLSWRVLETVGRGAGDGGGGAGRSPSGVSFPSFFRLLAIQSASDRAEAASAGGRVGSAARFVSSVCDWSKITSTRF